MAPRRRPSSGLAEEVTAAGPGTVRRPARGDLVDRLFDVVVIGGGITGAASARDAALRGLSVLLVEKDDFGSGTSSRSSKLIHGGLRYLQTYQFGLVAESLRERERMLRLAPHLTEVRPFLYLLYDGDPESRSLLNLGLTFYDAASGAWLRRRHRMLSADEVHEREPHLATAGLRGAGLFYDALTDDARLTLATVAGAREAGAQTLNHAAVTGLLVEGGHARGVTITDRTTGATYDVHARQVLNATGPWTDRTLALETGAAHEDRLRPTKGVHIVLRRSDFPLGTAVFLRSPDDNRVVWPIPSLDEDLVYIGTTDTDYAGDPDRVVPDETDIRYLLNVANRAVPTARLTPDHVVGSWAGLRPLIAPPPGTSTGNTPREHVITTGPTGMLTIAGGKLTSNRVMAKHLVDAAVKNLGVRTAPYSAHKVPVAGGAPYDQAAFLAAASLAGVPDEVARSWARRYGSASPRVLARWTEDPEAGVVIGPRGLSRAEIRYCVAEEMCAGLADLLVRRTGIFFWERSGGLDEIEEITAELGSLLGWTADRAQQEVDDYRSFVAAHRPA